MPPLTEAPPEGEAQFGLQEAAPLPHLPFGLTPPGVRLADFYWWCIMI